MLAGTVRVRAWRELLEEEESPSFAFAAFPLRCGDLRAPAGGACARVVSRSRMSMQETKTLLARFFEVYRGVTTLTLVEDNFGITVDP